MVSNSVSLFNAESSGLAAFNGIAQQSRLVVTDLFPLKTEGFISNLEEEYFPFSYNLGVRVHSDSWGIPSYFSTNDYTIYSQDVDTFCVANKV